VLTRERVGRIFSADNPEVVLGMKFVWYLLFLCAAGFFGVIGIWTLLSNVKKTAQSLWRQEIIVLSFACQLYSYGLLLARYSSFLIPGFYFLAAQIPVLVNVAFQAASVPEERDRYWDEVNWAERCQITRSGSFALAQKATIGLIAAVTATIAALETLVYFTTAIPSAAATLAFIRLPMLTVLLTEAAFIPGQIGISLFEALSIPARRRLLGTLLAELVPIGMIVATLLWTFSPSAGIVDHSGLRFHLAYLPAVLLALIVYFIITCLPSLVGFTRGARQQSLIFEHRMEALAEAIGILRTPKADFYIPALTGLVEKLKQHRTEYAMKAGLRFNGIKAEQKVSSPSLAVWEKPGFYRAGDSTSAYPRLQSVTNANFEYNAGIHDLRLQYLNWLDSLSVRLQLTISDLEAKQEPATELQAASAWADSYADDRSDLIDRSSGKTNTIAAAIVSTIVTSIVSVFLTGFAGWLWSHVAQTLPR
jgi:hypothetical protein